MDPLKEAFSKIKEDINELKDQIKLLKEEFSQLKKPSFNQTIPTNNSSNEVFQTNQPTDKQTINSEKIALEGSYSPNYSFSIGNRGVPTDRQTDQQTDNSNTFLQKSSHNIGFNTKKDSLKEIGDILDSLDNIKKEIRLKFKRLTPQELLIFSTLYTLEETKNEVTYKEISKNTNLSESSIRDYINKLISKGIPIEKTRQNNKTITLNISKDLRKVATLDTILKLRDL